MTQKGQVGWNRGHSGFVVCADAQKIAQKINFPVFEDWQPDAPKYTETYRSNGGGDDEAWPTEYESAIFSRIEALERSVKDVKDYGDRLQQVEDSAELIEADTIQVQGMLESVKVYVNEASALKRDVESMMLSTRKMMDKFEFEAAKLRREIAGMEPVKPPLPKDKFIKWFGCPLPW